MHLPLEFKIWRGSKIKKTLDFSKSIYEICREFPEVIAIMKELGFENITNAAMLNTAGRVMTIPKGAAMKKINMDVIEKTFREKGFEFSNQDEGNA